MYSHKHTIKNLLLFRIQCSKKITIWLTFENKPLLPLSRIYSVKPSFHYVYLSTLSRPDQPDTTENAVNLRCQDFTVPLPLPLMCLRNVYTNGFQSTYSLHHLKCLFISYQALLGTIYIEDERTFMHIIFVLSDY